MQGEDDNKNIAKWWDNKTEHEKYEVYSKAVLKSIMSPNDSCDFNKFDKLKKKQKNIIIDSYYT